MVLWAAGLMAVGADIGRARNRSYCGRLSNSRHAVVSQGDAELIAVSDWLRATGLSVLPRDGVPV